MRPLQTDYFWSDKNLANQVAIGMKLCSPDCFWGIFYDIFLAEYEEVHYCRQIRYELGFFSPSFFLAHSKQTKARVTYYVHIPYSRNTNGFEDNCSSSIDRSRGSDWASVITKNLVTRPLPCRSRLPLYQLFHCGFADIESNTLDSNFDSWAF